MELGKVKTIGPRDIEHETLIRSMKVKLHDSIERQVKAVTDYLRVYDGVFMELIRDGNATAFSGISCWEVPGDAGGALGRRCAERDQPRIASFLAVPVPPRAKTPGSQRQRTAGHPAGLRQRQLWAARSRRWRPDAPGDPSQVRRPIDTLASLSAKPQDAGDLAELVDASDLQNRSEQSVRVRPPESPPMRSEGPLCRPLTCPVNDSSPSPGDGFSPRRPCPDCPQAWPGSRNPDRGLLLASRAPRAAAARLTSVVRNIGDRKPARLGACRDCGDAETGARGYLLTGRAAYLEPSRCDAGATSAPTSTP